MKKFLNLVCLLWKQHRKKWIIMRNTVLILLLSAIQVFATDSYAQTKRISLAMNDATIKEVLVAIEKQSEFYFLYNSELIDVTKKVNLSIEEEKVDEILTRLFSSKEVDFLIRDRYIVLTPVGGNAELMLAQQQRSVFGTVTDESGRPLPGVTVVVKGTTQGTVTNADGDYLLSNIPEDATLVFSFVGMRTKEVEVGNQTEIKVTMVVDTIGIEEVVAIGYGTIKKSDLTGAVASVKGESIAQRQVTQVSGALQGAVAGVTVTRVGNAPGAGATIRIRGITTIGDSNPLIIVDGVPMDNINDINPNDIEDISVLKDAASSAIYGSRAAAGVILVTTKRAKEGQLTLKYNANFGFESPTILPEFVDAVRYMELHNEKVWNDNNNTGDEYPSYPKDVIDNYASLHAQNPDLYPNTDWMGLILKDNAPKQSHVINISAGSKNIRTNASLAYDKIDALYDGRTYERLTARFNNDITINKFLTASFDFFAKRSISRQPAADPMKNLFNLPGIFAAMWQDGRVAEGKSGDNPYGIIKHGGFGNDWYNQVGGKASIDFIPVKGLKLTAVVSPTLNYQKGKKFEIRVPYYDAEDPTLYMGVLQSPEGGWSKTTKLTENRNDNYRVTTQFLANYQKSFGSHNFTLLGGYENFYAFNENTSASRDQYDLTSFPYLNLGPLEYRDNSGGAWENAYRSWFGRVMYNYENKYYLQGNVRFDASSRFHEDYRWGSFPSFSAGWVISEESFMQDESWLSFLKLRASWGALGNERIGNYPYQSTIAFNNALFYQGNSVVSAQTAAQIQYAIQNISWEKTESYDLGFDAYLFDSRLRLTGDYYQKSTRDMLLPLEIPDYIGFDNPDQNTGKMNTRGWDAEIGWNDKVGEVNYSVAFNVSDFKSVMGDLGGIEFLGNQVKFEGSEFNEWYGYKSDGLFQTQEEVDNSATINNNIGPGDIKFLDISGPDGNPDDKITPEYDRTLLGGSLPHYIFGANLSLVYKGFDFSMVFQGVAKQNSLLERKMVFRNADWGNFSSILEDKYWSVYNTDAQNQKAEYPRLTDKSPNYSMSDYWLINGGYIRLKNVTLGYQIPSRLTQKINIDGIRIYTSATDLFVIDKFPKGWDPEVSTSSYPITSTYIFGITLNF
jgi:TonB-linked SusC/RagA family outer membrane protein